MREPRDVNPACIPGALLVRDYGTTQQVIDPATLSTLNEVVFMVASYTTPDTSMFRCGTVLSVGAIATQAVREVSTYLGTVWCAPC